MKLLSKLLILTAILPYRILAMEAPRDHLYPVSSPPSSFSGISREHLAPNFNAVNWPTKIDRIILTSEPIDTTYIPKYSKQYALLGALIGGSTTGSYVQKYGKHLSFMHKAGITLGGAAIFSALSYLGTHKILTNRATTQARTYQENLAKDQATMNSIIDSYSAAHEACQKINLNRNILNILLDLDNPSIYNRLSIYKLASNEPALDPQKKDLFPISNAIDFYLEEKISDIETEEEALKNVKTDPPQFKNSYSKATIDNINDVMKEIQDNCKIINQANSALPQATIRTWIDIVRTYPEYTTEKMFVSTFFQMFPLTVRATRDALKAVLKSASQDLINARYDKQKIQDIINKIKKQVDEYEHNAYTYNRQIIDYNEQVKQISEPILTFIKNCGGIITTHHIDKYNINRKLFNYENRCKEVAEDCRSFFFHKWIQDCFPEESHSDKYKFK